MSSSDTSGEVKPLFVSRSDQRGRYFYRIPSLVTVNKNRYLVAFAEQRVAHNQDSGDINVVFRVSYDDGKNWSSIHKACELGRDTCGNPTAVVDQRTGVIHLFMNSNPGHKSQFHEDPARRFASGDRKILYRQARFEGKSLKFSPLEDLTGHLQPAGTKMDMVGPGVGIQLSHRKHQNWLLIPAARRTLISKDGGESWEMSSLMPNLSSESAIAELDNGVIYRNDRSTGRNKCRKDDQGNLLPGSPLCRRSISFSENSAQSFSTPSISHRLFDPIAQGSLLRYSQGRIFFANCASTKNRSKLTIRMGSNGRSWPISKRIDSSCGYSSMAKTRDYHVGILYERKGIHADSWRGEDRKVPQDLMFRKFKLSYFQ